jgi:hypothetical protein
MPTTADLLTLARSLTDEFLIEGTVPLDRLAPGIPTDHGQASVAQTVVTVAYHDTRYPRQDLYNQTTTDRIYLRITNHVDAANLWGYFTSIVVNATTSQEH